MSRTLWNEKESCCHFYNFLVVCLRKPQTPPQDIAIGSLFQAHSLTITFPHTSLSLTLEGYKVREVHSCHSFWFSLDVKKRPCNHPAVLWDNLVQELVPSTELNLNGHWPFHHKVETHVGSVVGTRYREINSGDSRELDIELITLHKLTDYLLDARPYAAHWVSSRVATSSDVTARRIWG